MTHALPLAPASEGPSPARSLASGPVLFARYAYGPNRFGYCGPDDADELLEAGAAGQDRVLRALAQPFEGAYPYLALIARSAGIADPLDRRVVEAYWLGSELLRCVPVSAFGASIDERFRDRVRPTDWRWLATKPIDGAKPVHAFHVLDVFPRVGLIRGGQIDGVLQVMPSWPSACWRMWQWKAHAPGSSQRMTTSQRSPGLTPSVSHVNAADPRAYPSRATTCIGIPWRCQGCIMAERSG